MELHVKYCVGLILNIIQEIKDAQIIVILDAKDAMDQQYHNVLNVLILSF